MESVETIRNPFSTYAIDVYSDYANTCMRAQTSKTKKNDF